MIDYLFVFYIKMKEKSLTFKTIFGVIMIIKLL